MRLIAVIIILQCSIMCWGRQAGIRGKVADSTTGKPLSFVTVRLVRASTILSAIVTDSVGNYLLTPVAAGDYRLLYTLVGYDSAWYNITVPRDTATISRPTTMLSPATKLLTDVTVVARKPVIERQIDGLVYNAGSDAQLAGGTALDVLRKVPLVIVNQDGGVSITGSQTVKVFIDDKPAELYGATPGDYLAQLPADKIDRVKVITNPSAKYDAEGAGTVLLIYTKKKTAQYLTGSARLIVRNRLNNLYGGNIFYKKKKLALSLNTAINTFRRYRETDLERSAPKNTFTLNQQLFDTTVSTYFFVSANADMQIDSLNSLNINVTINNYIFRSRQLQLNALQSAGSTQQSARHVRPNDNNIYPVYSIAYSRRFKREGQELSFLSYYNTRHFNQQYNLFDDNGYTERYQSLTDNNEWSIQGDYTQPGGNKSKWEMGAKAVMRRAGNSFAVQPFDVARAGDFAYHQNIYAGYISFETALGKWQLRTGLRYERTQTDAQFNMTDASIKSFGNLAPNLVLSTTFKNKNSLSISYRQSISRPYISFLNPAINYSDSLNISTGNPALKPSASHNMEVAYTFSFKSNSFLRLSTHAIITDNNFIQVARVTNNGVTFKKWENTGTDHAADIAASWNQALTQKLKMIFNVTTSWQQLKLPEFGLSSNYVRFYTTLYFNYTFSKTFSAEAFAMFQTPYRELQTIYHYSVPQYYVLSASKKLWNDKAGISLSIDNPFKRMGLYQENITDADFVQQSKSYSLRRVWQLRFTYRFNSSVTETHSRAGKKAQSAPSE